MSTCQVCGANNKAGARYCHQCGQPLAAAPTAALGTLMQGRYQVIGLLGQGGMGAVYRVADQHISGKILAMKEMADAALLTAQDRQEALAAFEQEACLLAGLAHPNIPRVSDFFTENHKHYIVMEYVPGTTLADDMAQRGQPYDEAQVLAWARQLCDVLAYLHGYNPPIIFRDLKPANVMLTPQRQLKLIDFGIARLFKSGQSQDTMVIGTHGYAPPEQYGKGQTDVRSDIYSFGVLLHHLLTGHDPATTPFSLPPVRQLNPGVSAGLAKVIARATQNESARRYQSIAELEHDLPGTQPQGPTVIQPPPPKQPAGIPAWAALSIAGAALLVGYLLFRPHPGAAPAPAAPALTRIVVTATPQAAATAAGPGATGAAAPTAAPAPTEAPAPGSTDTSVPDPTSTPAPDWAAYETAIRQVVDGYRSHKVAFFTDRNAGPLSDYLMDPMLKKQQQAVCWLKKEHYLYHYSGSTLDIERVEFQDDSHAILLGRIIETRDMRKESGEIIETHTDEDYRALYQLQRVGDNRWLVYCIQAPLADGDPLTCEVKFTDPDPCE